MRPYNSLPRGQDVNNYPSLAAHQATHKSENKGSATVVSSGGHSHKSVAARHSPARRAHSEDVYAERKNEGTQTTQTQQQQVQTQAGVVKEILEKSMEAQKGKIY